MSLDALRKIAEQFQYLDKYRKLAGVSDISQRFPEPINLLKEIERRNGMVNLATLPSSLHLHEILSKHITLINTLKTLPYTHPINSAIPQSIIDSLNHISELAVKKSNRNKNWDSWGLIEESLDEISELSEESFTPEVSTQTEKLIERIVERILANKNTNAWIITYLFALMNILSFIKDGHDFFSSLNDISNTETVRQINNSNNKQKISMDSLAAIYDLRRYCIRNCYLQKKCTLKSKRLGIIYQNQIVTVIGMNHKWLCVAYIDDYSGGVKSGWVLKKYFKRQTK